MCGQIFAWGGCPHFGKAGASMWEVMNLSGLPIPTPPVGHHTATSAHPTNTKSAKTQKVPSRQIAARPHISKYIVHSHSHLHTYCLKIYCPFTRALPALYLYVSGQMP